MSGGIGNMLFFDLFSSWKCARSKGFSGEPPSSGLCVVRLRWCWCVGVGVGVMLTPHTFPTNTHPFPSVYVQNTSVWSGASAHGDVLTVLPFQQLHDPLDDVLHPRRHKPLIKCELGVRAVTPPHNNPSSCPPSCPTLAQAHPQSTNSSTMDATFTPTKLQPGNLATDRTAFRSPPMAHSLSLLTDSSQWFLQTNPRCPIVMVTFCWVAAHCPVDEPREIFHQRTDVCFDIPTPNIGQNLEWLCWDDSHVILIKQGLDFSASPQRRHVWVLQTEPNSAPSCHSTQFTTLVFTRSRLHQLPSGIIRSASQQPSPGRKVLPHECWHVLTMREQQHHLPWSWRPTHFLSPPLRKNYPSHTLGHQQLIAFLLVPHYPTPHEGVLPPHLTPPRGLPSIGADVNAELRVFWDKSSRTPHQNPVVASRHLGWCPNSTHNHFLALFLPLPFPTPFAGGVHPGCLGHSIDLCGSKQNSHTCMRFIGQTVAHPSGALLYAKQIWDPVAVVRCLPPGRRWGWLPPSRPRSCFVPSRLRDPRSVPYRHQRPSRPHDAHSDITGNRGHSQKHVSHCSMDDWARTPRAPDLCHGTATESEIPTPTRTCIGCQLKRRSTQHRRTCRHAHETWLRSGLALQAPRCRTSRCGPENSPASLPCSEGIGSWDFFFREGGSKWLIDEQWHKGKERNSKLLKGWTTSCQDEQNPTSLEKLYQSLPLSKLHFKKMMQTWSKLMPPTLSQTRHLTKKSKKDGAKRSIAMLKELTQMNHSFQFHPKIFCQEKKETVNFKIQFSHCTWHTQRYGHGKIVRQCSEVCTSLSFLRSKIWGKVTRGYHATRTMRLQSRDGSDEILYKLSKLVKATFYLLAEARKMPAPPSQMPKKKKLWLILELQCTCWEKKIWAQMQRTSWRPMEKCKHSKKHKDTRFWIIRDCAITRWKVSRSIARKTLRISWMFFVSGSAGQKPRLTTNKKKLLTESQIMILLSFLDWQFIIQIAVER